MLTFLANYLHVKNLRYQWIPSRDILDERILQYHWPRDRTDPTQPKEVVSDAIFMIMSMQNIYDIN